MLERWHDMACLRKGGREHRNVKFCCASGLLHLPCGCADIDFRGSRIEIDVGADGPKYRLLAPESTIAVLCMLACTASAYDRGGGLAGKVLVN